MTYETTLGLAYGGFNLNNEADEYAEEAQKHRPMGRDALKAKKNPPLVRSNKTPHTIEESGVGYKGGGA
ncbi:hypothetical protein Tco_0273465 [Tanacetum coccineum]